MKNKIIIAILFVMIIVSSNTVTPSYSYFDRKEKIKNETITLGSWEFIALLIGPDFAADFGGYVDNEIAQDPNSVYQYIYTQTDFPANEIITTPDIEVFGYSWTFWGKGKTNNYETLGYPSLIDRDTDTFGNPVHDINPEYSITPLYQDYNFFTVYDAMNSLTNNQYSLRLNYNNRMTTTSSISNITNISFYAMLGLSDPNDLQPMRSGQKMYVEVSLNGNSWTKIGTPTPVQVTSESENFTHYSFDIPNNLLGQDLFVRIRYNGRTLSGGYGRLIIDDLTISTS
ncbi:hypothetical protein KQ51_00984 [Candidatus Izimaplasma bacterium HR1]|uniref:hypothetical protein n=1 Tax=Candidatus Izimoplasma sp. HR1 TaxID=1541959 RepID=UPI0004F67AB5|nr:hypothetical protein KQ51_00984 [Candidatus Izimaplasma bacterium HR1]